MIFIKVSEGARFSIMVFLIIGDHRRMDPLKQGNANRGLDSFGRIVGSFIGIGIDKGKIDHTLLNHTDVNTILNLLVSGCNINFNNLALYNKNTSLGINEPFATNVVTDYLGLVLIRTNTKQPLLIKLHRNVDIEKIEDPIHKQIIAYTLLNSAWLNERQHCSK